MEEEMDNSGGIVPYDFGSASRGLTPAVGKGTRLPNPLPGLIMIVAAGLGYALFPLHAATGIGSILGFGGILAAGGILASAIRIAAQWEKAVVFRFGKFKAVRGPGLFTIIPFVDAITVVDTRILTLDIPRRQAITKDNVPVSLDGVIFLRVSDPAAAVTRVNSFTNAIQQYAQTALRDIVGSMTLDEILADREQVGKRIEEMVEQEIDGWGLDVAAIRIQDIELPEDLKRVMARQASAEREKRANITKSEGDRLAAENLAAAARMMSESAGALQLRTLQTLDGLGSSASNTVVIALPMELAEALRAVPRFAEVLRGQSEKKEPDASS